MTIRRLILSVAVAFFASGSALAQTHLTATEAASHIGERATVCGHVASTRYASSSKSQPTFLNLDKPYPNAIFTVVIWNDDRSKFGNPEATYRDANVCVNGTISKYRGQPEVVVHEPSQIQKQ